MAWSEGFPAPEETEVPEEVQAKEADFADAPKTAEPVEQPVSTEPEEIKTE